MRPRVRDLVVVLCAATLVAGASGCGKLDRDAVASDVDQIASAAAEGTLVAREAAAGRAHTGFTWIRTAELHHDAQAVQEKLDGSSTEAGLRSSAEQAASLAEQLRASLQQLHLRPGDRRLAERVRRQLAAVSDKAQRLSDQL